VKNNVDGARYPWMKQKIAREQVTSKSAWVVIGVMVKVATRFVLAADDVRYAKTTELPKT